MVSKKKLVTKIQKLIYGLFVLWLGVLAPLVYFDRFAASHYVQPYRFALFDTRTLDDTFPPETIASQLVQQLKQQMTRQQDIIFPTSPLASLAHSLQSILSQLYLGAGATVLLCLLFRRLSLVQFLSALSAELPPPDKPPRLMA